jgi:hypothetical protein
MRERAWARRAWLGAVLALAASSWAMPQAVAGEIAAKRRIAGFYQMPFPCAESWTGSTRRGHSPSGWSIDWNRPGDVDDLVVASAPGTVRVANATSRRGYGYYVEISHAGGESTLYAHLNSVAVTAGQYVDQGTVLGTVGATGNATGAHLHYEQRTRAGVAPAVFAGRAFSYGSTQTSSNCVDVPFAANFEGSAAAELGFFRRKGRFQVRTSAGRVRYVFGGTGDQPVVGDWDGDGLANVGVRRGVEGLFYLSTPQGGRVIPLGVPSDRPIAGDWNGDGRFDVGVHRGSTGQFFLRAEDGTLTTVSLGDADDMAVTGDWNGDGITDLGVFDPGTATFTLRLNHGGSDWFAYVSYGAAGDLPVVGDWDGNGVTDLGVWRPREARLHQRIAPSPRAPLRRERVLPLGEPRPTL